MTISDCFNIKDTGSGPVAEGRARGRRVYVRGLEWESGEARVVGADAARLIKTLRLRRGQRFEAVDGRGGAWSVEAVDIRESAPEVRVRAAGPGLEGAPQSPWTLAQGLLKGAKMDAVVAAAAELGVRRIIPFISERSVPRGGDYSGRIERWRGIAAHAAEVSGVNTLTRVDAPVGFDELLGAVPAHAPALMMWEDAGDERLGAAELPGPAGAGLIIVGPEGGLSSAEAALVRAAGARTLSLGPRILSAHHAGAAALAAVSALAGDMIPLAP